MLFHIIFSDGTKFIGGNYKNTKWLEIPENKKIQQLYYALPFGDYLFLSGWDKYCSFVEVSEDLSGEDKGIKKLEYTYLVCKLKNNYRIYKISVKTGGVEVINTDKDNEIIKQINPVGWRG